MMSAKLSVSLLIWLYLNYLWLRYSWNCINSFEIIKMFKGLFRKGRQLIWRLLLTRMMNCFCRKAFSHITSQRSVDRGSHHCKPPDTPRTGFKLSQNLSLGFGRESCAVVITTTPRRYYTRLISTETSPLQKTSDGAWTENAWFPSANCPTLSYSP